MIFGRCNHEEPLRLIFMELHSINTRLEKMERIMSTVPTGLAALQQADTDL